MNIAEYLTNIRILEAEKESVLYEFQKRNITRLNMSVRFILPLFLILIFFFLLDLNKGSAIEQKWRIGIILSHSTLFFVLLCMLISSYYLCKKDEYTKNISFFTTHFTYFFPLFIGGVLATIDQLVTTAINPFIITCLVMPLFLIIRPLYSLFWYTLAIIIFLIIEPITQSNPNILLSNTANGISAATMGYALSVILWQINLKKFRQELIINKQNEVLEKQNAKLILNTKELNHAIQTKDKFFSIISHDLKSPFQGFIGLTQLMAEGNIDISKAELMGFSKSLHDSASTVYKLLENLLEWAQMQKGEISFAPHSFLLSEAVEQIINTFKQRADQKGITILNDFPSNQYVFGDDKMINAVLRNLLSNAVKFTRRNGNIIVGAKETEDKMLEIFVNDNGVGLSPRDVNNLFKIEEKVSSPGTDGELSSGLGLLLCKEFVEKNGGKIRAESQQETGSTFYFTVPKEQ